MDDDTQRIDAGGVIAEFAISDLLAPFLAGVVVIAPRSNLHLARLIGLAPETETGYRRREHRR